MFSTPELGCNLEKYNSYRNQQTCIDISKCKKGKNVLQIYIHKLSIKLEYFIASLLNIPGSCLAVTNIDHSLFICNSSALVNVYEFQWISIPLEGANVVKDQTYTYCRQLLPKRKLILIFNLSLYLTTSLSRNIR